jgi:hypothetical protein
MTSRLSMAHVNFEGRAPPAQRTDVKMSAQSIPPFSPARALWDNRNELARAWSELKAIRGHLQDMMGGPRDFGQAQSLQLASMVYDFKPDLIVELGRGYGNSTCAMAFAAKLMRPQPCRFVSLCLSDAFNKQSLPYLKSHLKDPGVLDPVEAIETDILNFDFAPVIGPAKRVFVFWDAHGFDVAQTILVRLLRPLRERPHVAVIHDMADLTYMPEELKQFGSDPKWYPYGTAGPKYILGTVGAQYEEGIALVDFASRNRMTLASAESSYFRDLTEAQARELETQFGDDFSRYGFWYYFSLNGLADRAISFPEIPPLASAAASPASESAEQIAPHETASADQPKSGLKSLLQKMIGRR